MTMNKNDVETLTFATTPATVHYTSHYGEPIVGIELSETSVIELQARARGGCQFAVLHDDGTGLLCSVDEVHLPQESMTGLLLSWATGSAGYLALGHNGNVHCEALPNDHGFLITVIPTGEKPGRTAHLPTPVAGAVADLVTAHYLHTRTWCENPACIEGHR